MQDYWNRVKNSLRRFCKGWSANFNGQIRRKKTYLLNRLNELDDDAERGGLTRDQWSTRYDIEEQLERIYAIEEVQWQRRGGAKWILEGDANTGFFHSMANGRKRKCTIFSLESDHGEIRGESEIKDHVENYYKKLFGREETGNIRMRENMWSEEGRLSDAEAQELVRPFTMKELEEALKDMDPCSAPGADGLGVGFYLTFWD